jgi:starch synthase
MNGKTDARYAEAKDTGCTCTFNLGTCGDITAGFYHQHKDNVDFVFVDHPCFHRSGGPYGDDMGTYGDNQFRFCLLSLAACEAPLNLHVGTSSLHPLPNTHTHTHKTKNMKKYCMGCMKML